ncbi:MAG: phosphotransferase [Oceanospirillaceae bacterium]|nr:phosphotransferase [Oceanospirillaceae bacterium]MBT13705.1 phosphotransferase [Oceanospirillaceae bacterium]|tara:strand:+ start:9238 stop:10116 length:879 start_codon:yes stop_codon:yes gene_type:complete
MNRHHPTSLAELGTPLVSARSAEIYHWQSGQIVKLFRADFCRNSARQEHINADEAHRQGATHIECLGEVTIEGRTGIIMKRLDGTTLTAAADRNPLNIIAVPRTLARLHAKVHDTQTQVMQDIRLMIRDYLDHPALAFLSAEERARAASYLQTLPDGDSILHMDFHTENILVNRQTETVIDWATAARGHAGADMAMTWFLFHEAELFPGISRAQTIFYNLMRRLIYRRYIRHYANIRQLTKSRINQDIERWYPAALICRLAMWSAPSEVAPLRKKIRGLINRPTADNRPEVI